jgi:hypothetical protein
VVTNNRIFAGPGATRTASTARSLAFFHNYIPEVARPAPPEDVRDVPAGQQRPDRTFDNNIIDTGRMAAERYGVYEERGLAGFTPQEFAHNGFVRTRARSSIASPPPRGRTGSPRRDQRHRAQYYGNLDVDRSSRTPRPATTTSTRLRPASIRA